jgi:hypothetical protein
MIFNLVGSDLHYEPGFSSEDKALSFELRFKSKKKVRTLYVNGQF